MSTESDIKVDDFWQFILENDHAKMRAVVAMCPSFCHDSQYYLFPKKSLTLHPDGSNGFELSITFETMKLLFEIGFLRNDDIEFLYQYMRTTNCDQKFDMLMKIIYLYDKEALRTFVHSPENYRENILFGCMGMFYKYRSEPCSDADWMKLMMYLIDDVGVDIHHRVYCSDCSWDEQDDRHTIMCSAIWGNYSNLIRELAKRGLDVNEFDGNCSVYNRTPIMCTAVRIGDLIRKNDPDHKERIQFTLDRLFETCVTLRDLGYDFSVVNYREKDPMLRTRMGFRPETVPDSMYGHRFSDYLTEYGLPTYDARFAEFV
jgi:hypothetical protein